jgi:hypothetical protein
MTCGAISPLSPYLLRRLGRRSPDRAVSWEKREPGQPIFLKNNAWPVKKLSILLSSARRSIRRLRRHRKRRAAHPPNPV